MSGECEDIRQSSGGDRNNVTMNRKVVLPA
jgi:hypothetical protein